eukprot:scaffold1640_cov111-Isochrysis_galbana.AAC.27
MARKQGHLDAGKPDLGRAQVCAVRMFRLLEREAGPRHERSVQALLLSHTQDRPRVDSSSCAHPQHCGGSSLLHRAKEQLEPLLMQRARVGQRRGIVTRSAAAVAAGFNVCGPHAEDARHSRKPRCELNHRVARHRWLHIRRHGCLFSPRLLHQPPYKRRGCAPRPSVTVIGEAERRAPEDGRSRIAVSGRNCTYGPRRCTDASLTSRVADVTLLLDPVTRRQLQPPSAVQRGEPRIGLGRRSVLRVGGGTHQDGPLRPRHAVCRRPLAQQRAGGGNVPPARAPPARAFAGRALRLRSHRNLILEPQQRAQVSSPLAHLAQARRAVGGESTRRRRGRRGCAGRGRVVLGGTHPKGNIAPRARAVPHRSCRRARPHRRPRRRGPWARGGFVGGRVRCARRVLRPRAGGSAAPSNCTRRAASAAQTDEAQKSEDAARSPGSTPPPSRSAARNSGASSDNRGAVDSVTAPNHTSAAPGARRSPRQKSEAAPPCSAVTMALALPTGVQVRCRSRPRSSVGSARPARRAACCRVSRSCMACSRDSAGGTGRPAAVSAARRELRRCSASRNSSRIKLRLQQGGAVEVGIVIIMGVPQVLLGVPLTMGGAGRLVKGGRMEDATGREAAEEREGKRDATAAAGEARQGAGKASATTRGAAPSRSGGGQGGWGEWGRWLCRRRTRRPLDKVPRPTGAA